MKTLARVSSLALQFAMNGDLLHKAVHLPQLPMAIMSGTIALKVCDRVAPSGELYALALASMKESAREGQKIGYRAMFRDPSIFERRVQGMQSQ